jgi:hypothetical protein
MCIKKMMMAAAFMIGAVQIVLADGDEPVTAVWTGAANDNAFVNPANWSCLNAQGVEIATPVAPNEKTMRYILMTDADWREAALSLEEDVTLDLNGHTLRVNGGFTVAEADVSDVNLVSNPSFETGPTLNSGGYVYWSTSSFPPGWSWNVARNGVGSTRKGGPWISADVPDGSCVCFLQASTKSGGSWVSQDVAVPESGYYAVSFAYGARKDSGYSGGTVTVSIGGKVCCTDQLTRHDTAPRTGKAIVYLDAGTSELKVGAETNPVEGNSDQDMWIDMISVKKVAAGVVDSSGAAAGDLRIEMTGGDALTRPVAFSGNMTVSYVLMEDADWTAAGHVELPVGMSVDLNGHTLKVVNVTGPGVVLNTANAYYKIQKAADGLYMESTYLQTNETSDKYNHAKEWINTRYVHNAKTVVDMRVQIAESTGDWYCYYGARNGTTTALGGWIHKTYHFKGVTFDAGTNVPYPANSFDVHMEFGGTCSFGDFSYTSGAGGSCSRFDYLFAMNNNGAPGFGAKAKIDYCLVREKNDAADGGYDVIRDFVPVKRLSDEAPGMFDRKNRQFYPNSGGGRFVVGPSAVAAEHAAFGKSGVLRISVPANTMLSLDEMATIVGDVKIVKEGVGTLTYDEGTSKQTYFLGGYEDHSAPLIAVWTGAAGDDDFANAQNWSCTYDLGSVLAGALPNENTHTYILAADADWTARGAFELPNGVRLDLNGRSLKVAGLTGDGLVVNGANKSYTTHQSADGQFYIEAEYLQSWKTKSQNMASEWIDTGYQPQANTVVDMKVEVTERPTDWYCYFGARSNVNRPATDFGAWVYKKDHFKGVGADAFADNNPYPYPETPFAVHMEFGGLCTFGSFSYESGAGGSCGLNAYLFAMNNRNNTAAFIAKAKIYHCLIREKNDASEDGYDVMRDFVAVKRLSDGSAGMFDRQNGAFYGNRGDGEFLAGPYVTATNHAAFGQSAKLEFVVPAGTTLALDEMVKIVGDVKVVKGGDGFLIAPAGETYFLGGYEDPAAVVGAVWTGAAGDNVFMNAGNWTGTNALGHVLAGACPTVNTVDVRLAADADWRAAGETVFARTATINLCGYRLQVSRLPTAATITDTIGYQRLEYLQADQNGAGHWKLGGQVKKIQCIDTGYKHNATTEVDLRLSYVDSSFNGYGVVYGARSTSNGEAYQQMGFWTLSGRFMKNGSSTGDLSETSHAAVNGTVYDVHVSKSGKTWVKEADGSEEIDLGTGNGSGENNAGNDFLFAINQSNSSAEGYWPSKCRIYFCKIYDNGRLVRDFVPVMRNSDGKPGLLDLVEGKFYGKMNADADEFTPGPALSSDAGGEILVDVPEGETLAAGTVTLAGCARLVKSGAGALDAPLASYTTSGQTTVLDGTLACGVNGPVQGVSARSLFVARDAAFNLNGKTDYGALTVILNGGTVFSSADIGADKAQLTRIRLEGDSAFDVSRSWGLIGTGYSQTALDLGGRTLSLAVAAGKNFYLYNTVVAAGTVVATGDGKLTANKTAVSAPATVFDVGCALDVAAPMTVLNYVARYTGASNAGNEPIVVEGTFLPVADRFHGCRLQNGAVLDLSAWPSAAGWPLVSRFTTGLTSIAFAEQACVTVSLAGRQNFADIFTAGGYLLKWGEAGRPEGVTFRLDEKTRRRAVLLLADETGLRLVSNNLILIVK